MASPQSAHRRNPSTKANRPRRMTKGPLDGIDDPPVTSSAASSPSRSQTHSPSGSTPTHRRGFPTIDNIVTPLNKDFSFLLRQEIYHPLSQLNIPPAFRSEYPTPSPDETLAAILNKLDDLLKEGRFLQAAHFSGAILTSPILSPTDHQSIFYLLHTRLACLELTGNVLLAGQEAKALEDLNSSFYFLDADLEVVDSAEAQSRQSLPRHIVPWPLRVLAIWLQSIGFGDARRGISGLYELGLEARRNILRPGVSPEDKKLWKERLVDLGIRVVNALVDIDDMDAARRSLANLHGSDNGDDVWKSRMALLHLRIGDVNAAREVLGECNDIANGTLNPLLSMAEGRYVDAVDEWRSCLQKHQGKEGEALITQNLAVCLLYTGELNEARELLESLVATYHSFSSLTFNLSTIYELCSDKSRTLKLGLAEKLAKQPRSGERNWEKPNADFKL
ncbi:hypothetical protein FQN54_003996 [Arachnomyces sp. PD_36]|nr:hypothetical protein FQN54_003996 [Arachnomyces sp. PD_36]